MKTYAFWMEKLPTYLDRCSARISSGESSGGQQTTDGHHGSIRKSLAAELSRGRAKPYAGRPSRRRSRVDHCVPQEEKGKPRGSRFESGAEIPAPVSILLGLYFTKTISDGDLGRAERVLLGQDLVSLGQ
jgi:hypothetical protein